MAALTKSLRLVATANIRKPSFKAASAVRTLQTIQDLPIRWPTNSSHLRRKYGPGQSLDASEVPEDTIAVASTDRFAPPTGYYISRDEHGNETRHAAFLGEADSDNAFEAMVDADPEHYRHKIDDARFSGIHGQAGEGDEPIEREPRVLVAVDATNAAYLGEADSDDAFEADVAANPGKYRHVIVDARPSGMHGQSGEGDEPIEKQ